MVQVEVLNLQGGYNNTATFKWKILDQIKNIPETLVYSGLTSVACQPYIFGGTEGKTATSTSTYVSSARVLFTVAFPQLQPLCVSAVAFLARW